MHELRIIAHIILCQLEFDELLASKQSTGKIRATQTKWEGVYLFVDVHPYSNGVLN